ncbi:hypothetical protein [Shigella phage ESh16]|nr:hypothetical protein [Shigella phage ESh16]
MVLYQYQLLIQKTTWRIKWKICQRCYYSSETHRSNVQLMRKL